MNVWRLVNHVVFALILSPPKTKLFLLITECLYDRDRVRAVLPVQEPRGQRGQCGHVAHGARRGRHDHEVRGEEVQRAVLRVCGGARN